MACFTHYWEGKTCDAMFANGWEGEPLDHAAGKIFTQRGVGPGDKVYVVNNFKGEIFCSGFGIWIDYRVNPEGHRRLFEIMERCDGERTISEIAQELGISYQSVKRVTDLLYEKKLVSYSRYPASTAPRR